MKIIFETKGLNEVKMSSN